MKALLYITALILLLSLESCLNADFNPAEWAPDPELEFSKSTVVFSSASSNDSIEIFTNYADFEAESSESWCRLTKSKTGSSIIINADPNIDINQRSALITITISRGKKILSKTISVFQTGGVWDFVGDFNVYWYYEISDSQKSALTELLNNMVRIEGGEFYMGYSDEQTIVDNAQPHRVKLSSFYLSKYEITQNQWMAVMGYNNSSSKGVNLPVYNISWSDALEFATRLTKLTNLKVNLPTEAQWEFAAKGGNKSKGYIYPGSDKFDEVAYVSKNTDPSPAEVGTLICNELGLYDMAGNVSEYCFDWFATKYVDPEQLNPTGPPTGVLKCVRGGNLTNFNESWLFRSTNRMGLSKGLNAITEYTGFRIVITE